ncbi:MAG TPA: tetratricopeptide repeat protein [Phycisphaerae bacterium]|nr:tetratricopeptide repeat protein [Phycisphaerae bacterium]
MRVSLTAWMVLAAAAVGGGMGGVARGVDLADAQLLYAGKYAECLDACSKEIIAGNTDPPWYLLKIRVQMTLGQYEAAMKTAQDALDHNGGALDVRLAMVGVLRANNKPDEAKEMLASIRQLAADSPWRYGDPDSLIALGKAELMDEDGGGLDARKVLEQYFDKAKAAEPNSPEPLMAEGALGLQKHDNALAAESFEAAIKLDATNPDAYVGLAKALEDDPEKSNAALEKALALNPTHLDGLLLQANNLIDGEAYTQADGVLKKALAVNGDYPETWCYRAVLAHLAGDHVEEAKDRVKALETWETNPEVDYLIGEKLSANYRFEPGAEHQRQALKFDPEYLPAKAQLAQDLLRLAQEEEGWKLVKEVFKLDPYDVTAYNLVTLHDHMAKFRVVKAEHAQISMDPGEAALYGDRVAAMLNKEYAELSKKYEVTFGQPIHVEIFPEQKDFQIRTFGLPVGEGFLGVCFGPVLTMNSPAALTEHPENWQDILWHEFCHSITLTKTHNKMPRWLSEGISVYEERQRKAAWGEKMVPAYRELVLSGKATPVSKLSSAFLRPPTPLHLLFAYYESSMVVQYIDEHWGQGAMNAVLTDLGNDVPMNTALANHTEPMEKLDADFAGYLRKLAEELAPEADLDRPEIPEDAPPGLRGQLLAAFRAAHPENYWLTLEEAQGLVEARHFTDALPVIQKLIDIFPADAGQADDPHLLAAACYRGLNQPAQERGALAAFLARNGDAVEPRLRFLELAAGDKDWEAVRKEADNLLGINPLIPAPYRYLAQAATALGDRDAAIGARRTLLTLDPVNRVENHYELARLLAEENQLPEARRQVDMALEDAPRFRDGHRLLLSIAARMDGTGPQMHTNGHE